MKIALVHDYLREYGGAERVVEVFHEIWPNAPLYTSFVDWHALGEHAARFKDWDIRTSWVQHNPVMRRFHSPLRFLAPLVWNSFDLSGYDVVLSSSGWFMCRGVKTKKDAKTVRYEDSKTIRSEDDKTVRREDGKLSESRGMNQAIRPEAVLQRRNEPDGSSRSGHTVSTKHFCYIHHPPRNLYGYETGGLVEKYAVVRAYAAVINFFLRHYDYQTAQNVDFFIANSQETAWRVKKFYRRDSTVIYPPIEVAGDRLPLAWKRARDEQVSSNSALGTQGLALRAQQGQALSRLYYLSVGRLTYAKRIDVLIEACNQLNAPLKIVGTGREEQALRQMAGPTVEFLGSVSDEELHHIYAGAKALLFCARNEDFGMVPVEAMAHGVPVIALKEGGVIETVLDGKTGLFYEAPEKNSLIEAMKRFERRSDDWKPACVSQAKKFSTERFKKEIREFVIKYRHYQ